MVHLGKVLKSAVCSSFCNSLNVGVFRGKVLWWLPVNLLKESLWISCEPCLSCFHLGSHFLWGSWIHDQCANCKWIPFENCVMFFTLLDLQDVLETVNHQYVVCCLQDSVVMERLIEKYMSLPNQAWDNIVKEATRVSSFELNSWVVQSHLAKLVQSRHAMLYCNYLTNRKHILSSKNKWKFGRTRNVM